VRTITGTIRTVQTMRGNLRRDSLELPENSGRAAGVRQKSGNSSTVAGSTGPQGVPQDAWS
jgi:hypothetical protein